VISRDNTPKGLFGRLQYLECKNVGTADLVAYSAAEITGAVEVSERIILTVQRPTDFGWRPNMVTIGPAKISAGERGACLDEQHCFGAYDKGGAVPAKGETWGPIEDEGELHQHVPGGLVLRDGADGRVLIRRYEPGIIWAKTTASLSAGATGTVDFWRYDPDAGGNGSLQIVEDVTFEVTEASGETDTIDEDTFVFASWNQQAECYILQGWVC